MSKHDEDDHLWISLRQALAYATKMLKTQETAKLLLRVALADGEIPTRAEAVLTEHALGEVRSLQKRRKPEIDLKQRSDVAALSIEPTYLRREPRGVRLLFSWSANRIVWVEPQPTKTFTHKSTGLRGVVLGKRTVMYGIKLERASVEAAVRRKATNQKISRSISSRTRQYRRENDYRKLIPDIYELAETGNLDSVYGPFDLPRAKENFKKKLIIRCNHEISRTTAYNLLQKLLELDESVRSQKTNDQQLTNN